MAGLGFKPGATPKSSTPRQKRRKHKTGRKKRQEMRDRVALLLSADRVRSAKVNAQK
jgi:hypothetical protein